MAAPMNGFSGCSSPYSDSGYQERHCLLERLDVRYP